MFTYIDPTVRQRLVTDGKLVRIDANGQVLSTDSLPAKGDYALNVMGPIPLPIPVGDDYVVFDWYAAVRHTELERVESLASELREKGSAELFATLSTSMAVNSVLIRQGQAAVTPLIRVHSSCLTGDVFGSARCECGPQLDAALARIHADADGGFLIYMAGHEGRGIGLWAKAATYLLQDGGEDTYQANESLGLPVDSRDFRDAAALIHYFHGASSFRLLSNNPKKVNDLHAYGLVDIRAERHVVGVRDENRRYLEAKRVRGHRFKPDEI